MVYSKKKASSTRRRVNLTDQQVELLRLIAAGLSNSALAQALTVTPKAVEKSITRLADRMSIDRSGEGNLRVALTNRYLEYLGHHRG
jgi:DNA-binding NarL/FixJ family response regulator